MIFAKLLLVVTLMAGINVSLAQNAIQESNYEWEKIVPLITKKAEVEKLFGKPFLENGYVKSYNSKYGKLLVIYNGAENAEKPECEWNVSPDTVEQFSISLSQVIPISKVRFDLADFKKEQDHIGFMFYTNQEEGITFTTYFTDKNEEFVNSINYFPTSCDKEQKCIKQKIKAR